MEITGIECGHIDCNLRIWDDHPDRDKWLDVKMTSEGHDFEETAHYCPEHGGRLAKNTKFHHTKPNTGQERVINQELAQALSQTIDDANADDLVKAGLVEAAQVVREMHVEPDDTQWQPATPANGSPTVQMAVAGPTRDTTQLLDVVDQPQPRQRQGKGGKRPRGVGVRMALMAFCAGLFSQWSA